MVTRVSGMPTPVLDFVAKAFKVADIQSINQSEAAYSYSTVLDKKLKKYS